MAAAKFQSLLFWMIGSGQRAFERSGMSSLVSILVVLDDWFGLPSVPRTILARQVSILVVLDDWFGLAVEKFTP